MIVLSRRVVRQVVTLGLVLSVGCSDKSTGPEGGLTAAERLALTNLLSNQAFIQAMFAGNPAAAYAVSMLPLVAANVESVGTFEVGAGAPLPGTYQAFGGQFLVTVKPPAGNETKLVWTGIIGINNLSAPTDVITAAVIDANASTAPSTIGSTAIGTVGTRTASGSYIQLNGQQATTYAANTGQIAVSSTSFSGGTACPGVTATPQVQGCSYSIGTVAGSFNFTAQRVGGTGSITIPAVTVSVPAVQMSMTLNFSGS